MNSAGASVPLITRAAKLKSLRNGGSSPAALTRTNTRESVMRRSGVFWSSGFNDCSLCVLHKFAI
jgi:hypothetical protein